MLRMIISKIPFAVMTAFAFFLFATTLVYWNFKPDVNFLLTKQNLVHNAVWRTAFYIHISGGMLAIALGPFQFISKLREHYLGVHRSIGKVYVFAILVIGAPTGLYMAFFANGGACASFGFILMSILWFYTTWMGITTAMKKQIMQHKQWMIRSYAVTFSAVTLRLWVPFLSIACQMEHEEIIILTAWISWLFNLVAAELIIYSTFNKLKTKTI